MAYPTINETNITGLLGIAQYSNTITDGYFGLVTILCLAIVSFVAMKAFSTERALTASLFITSVFAIIFRAVDLISNNVMVPILVLGGLSLIWLIGSTDQ